MKERISIEIISGQIGRASYYLKHFAKYGMKEDAHYYEGQKDALQCLAMLSGFDMDEIELLAYRKEANLFRHNDEWELIS